jgi:lipopolysaccharide cholinephosphotransferase
MPAPADTHEVLTAIYGDYMQLPPEDKRVTHHAFTAHWGACTLDETAT